MKPISTVRDWFSCLDPAPPPALGAELTRLITHHANRPANEVTEVCMEVVEGTLRDLQTSGSSQRGSALTLLSIDALVTYAFEAAADDPARMNERTAAAMSRISMLTGAQ